MHALVFLALSIIAADPAGDGWKQVAEGDVIVFLRTKPGVKIAEIKADTLMPLTPAEVRDVLADESYIAHSPYIGEFRTLDHSVPNKWIRYTRLDLPVVDDRDYFIEVTREQDLGADGNGTYHASWKPWGLDRPTRKGVIRVTTNEGYWDVRSTPDGQHAQVEYYLMFDPGGSIPSWAVDAGNKRVLPDVLHALLKEGLKRRAAKAEAAK